MVGGYHLVKSRTSSKGQLWRRNSVFYLDLNLWATHKRLSRPAKLAVAYLNLEIKEMAEMQKQIWASPSPFLRPSPRSVTHFILLLSTSWFCFQSPQQNQYCIQSSNHFSHLIKDLQWFLPPVDSSCLPPLPISEPEFLSLSDTFWPP